MATSAPASEALVERLFSATIDALELLSVHLGTRLGLYGALRDGGPLTPGELAAAAGIHERYAREWLEQQAVAGFLAVEDAAAAAAERRYALPAEHAGVLAEPEDDAHVAPFARMLAGIGGVLPALVEAYRTGAGVPYSDYGADFRHGQGDINRPAFLHDLPATWIPAMPDVHARLADGERPARVADVGCGHGWAAVSVAQAYPTARVDGIDADAASIAQATDYAAAAGVADRVRFLERDAAALADSGPYDLVMILEVLHDLARPVETLAAVRAALAPGGSVLVADERVADAFTAPGDEIERMMYGWSVLHCLPTQMTEAPSAALGTVLRADTLRELAAAAGFAGVEVLPVDNDLFRFYRLRG
ncbi:MAG TPA: class I SAM-dependent methyltransferase [Solirubrobacteraceae bacterium]|nr:class I SAM-dependent methyltransferase [Solirubrobacteraceae bacterium]